mmetsp:Transcript_26123/g.44567  ORF Transcript_26123/g.44567 Transcript_26123/m.44567 type:complete len:93 (+) Transcript_26123:4-282(+)
MLTIFHTLTGFHSVETFHAIIGLYPAQADYIYKKYELNKEGVPEKEFMWTMSFLHLYGKNDDEIAFRWRTCKQTYFKKVWIVLFLLFDILDE